ncbi:MAG: hypothetical protein IKH59_04700 [Bacteroidaceae bacterium]|nr:hypothetical protein [Bacteroidaceae bacterium]
MASSFGRGFDSLQLHPEDNQARQTPGLIRFTTSDAAPIESNAVPTESNAVPTESNAVPAESNATFSTSPEASIPFHCDMN